MNLEQLKIISAGAGSGKTYRLTEEMVTLLKAGSVRPSGIIATTFTRKAAAELQERVRVKLLKEGLTQQADELTNALIGTVHGLGVKLLRRFAFEAGVSPQVDILPDGEQQQMFNQALAATLSLERIEEMDDLSDRLGLTKRTGFFDWRKEVRGLVDVARANDFSLSDLQTSKEKSWSSFAHFLPETHHLSESAAYEQLNTCLEETIRDLDQGEDHTKTTASATDKLRATKRELKLRGRLHWYQWAAIGKLNVGAKSREVAAPLQTMAWEHSSLPAFQQDIKRFIDQLFDTAIDALKEYDDYKKRRGLIDYTDMEVLVSRLLDKPPVRAVLKDELDLLMVDEFQDTNPIQLEVFLKLSQLATHSVWVGDPKQSIYGFRGAEPRLMEAIIRAAGGIKIDNVLTRSWRSRADLVYMVNDLFCKAFPTIPTEQVALEPVRVPEGNDFCPAEPIQAEDAIIHWHFTAEGDRRTPPANPWMEECLARSLQEWLAAGVLIQPKGSKDFRKATAGDVAVLCRSNAACNTVAEALHRAGMKAAIARAGLLNTAEARLVLACLKYILHQDDSLSVAEIQILSGQKQLDELVKERLEYLKENEDVPYFKRPAWAAGDQYISTLDFIRSDLVEASSAEILNQVLETLDLRRCVVRWGNSEQRLSNIDRLRQLALEYETNCNNTQTAASLGGFLLWLNRLAADEQDMQGANEDPLAVNVLTYHRSKGLEWPVVICHDLEQNLRADLWGVDLVAEQEEVDLTQVLKGRWLRYWVNPYSDQQAKTPLLEAMEESPQQAQKRSQALAEEARLLYVGLTRARDYLILPSRQNKPTKWLNRVYSQGDESIPVLDPNTHETPWSWAGHHLNKQTLVAVHPTQFPVAESSLQSVPFLQKVSGAVQHPDYNLLPQELKQVQGRSTKVGQEHQYFLPNTDTELEADRLAAVQALYLRAALYITDAEERASLAKAICERYDFPGDFDPRQLVAQADAWQNWLEQQFPQANFQQLLPIRFYEHGQAYAYSLDLLLQTDTTLAFCQNQLYTGSNYNTIAENTALALMAASVAWQEAGQEAVDSFWVHFVGLGKVVEVK
jgi:ATP-dependent exoDNAse (exonuclease V) beta subunit